MRNLCNIKKLSKLPHLSKFVDDLSQQSCKKHICQTAILKAFVKESQGLLVSSGTQSELLKPKTCSHIPSGHSVLNSNLESGYVHAC